ncbi:MAG: response regulator [Leptolyngbya sp. PLA1]|nr:response regulator [Leptolyngbya sp. PLA1]
MKLLIADDNEVSLTLLHATLSRAGYDVEVARDGEEALTRLRSGKIRLVVSDWEMPKLSGVELCRALRGLDAPGYVYVILVTGRDSSAATVEGFAAGADDFIRKPFEATELIARVRAGERILSLETRDVAIFAMAKLAESRDPETGAHLERVRSYCRVLARDLSQQPRFAGRVDGEFVRLIYLTSPLHDIGKVGIPDGVLLKPGRLSDREFEIMKMHARMGADTLEAAARAFPGVPFLEMAREIAATHHERWDGTGYPSGLSGESIPLSGRIMAVADVYDALTSARVYKAAMTHEVARSLIVDGSGTHFDPDLVEAFLRQEEHFLEISRAFGEGRAAA